MSIDIVLHGQVNQMEIRLIDTIFETRSATVFREVSSITLPLVSPMSVDGLVLLGAESSEATAITGVLVQLKGLLGKLLTYLPLEKMIAISQTIFAEAFSWMKSFVFRLKLHWRVFLSVQVTIT